MMKNKFFLSYLFNQKKIKNSISKKMLLNMFFISFVPLIFFGFLSIFSMNNVLKNETVSFYSDNIRQKDLYIDLVMSNVESLIANLSGNDEIINALTQKPTDSSYDRLTTQAKIGYILSSYSNLDGLISIDIFSGYGEHFHVGETLDITNVDTDLIDRLYNEATASESSIYWSGIETNVNKNSQYSNVITAAKLLHGTYAQTGQLYSQGLLIISYDPMVFSNSFNENSQKGNFSIVVDSKNRILFHQDQSIIGSVLSDSLTQHINSGNGNFEHMIDGKQMLVIYNKTAAGNWTVIDFIALQNIYANYQPLTIILICLLCIAVVFLLIFQRLLTKQLFHPIQQITETFRLLKNGDLDRSARLDLKSSDEISELANLFNDFIDAREDITTQKKLERQLNEQNNELQEALDKLEETQLQMFQQEKLAGIGQLAAGVAHEVNNPLGFVSSNFGMLKNYIKRYSELLDYAKNHILNSENPQSVNFEECQTQFSALWKENRIDFIMDDMTDMLSDTDEGLHRIETIVNGLKSFSRMNSGNEKNVFDLNENIQTTLLVATNEIKYRCKVHFEKGEIPFVYANAGQINQVILNMLLNAVHAIEEKFGDKKGEITIKTVSDQKYVCCSIRDNGIGMNAEVQKKMFNPFFTTKPVGKGTGLGLGIAYDIIVNKHNGKIDAESELNIGTCFSIYLPINTLEDTSTERVIK